MKTDGASSVQRSLGVDRSTSRELSITSDEILKRKNHKRFQSKMRSNADNDEEVMTFTVDSLTSQWDSEREESNDSDNQSTHEIDDIQLHSTKKRCTIDAHAEHVSLAITPLLTSKATAADDVVVSKRKSGLSAKRSYGRSHADKYAKKTKSSRLSGSMSKGKTIISLGISPTFSFGAKKKFSVDGGFRKSPEPLIVNNAHSSIKQPNRNQIDDVLVDSDESVSLAPAKSKLSTTKTARKRILESSSESDGSLETKKRVLESDIDSDDDEF